MRTVICTGTSGSERMAALKEVAGYGSGVKEPIEVMDTWEVIREVASEAVDEATILNWPEEKRNLLLEHAYREVAKRLGAIEQAEHKGSERTVVVATHAVFYWRSTYMEAFPKQVLSALSADCFVTIVHNIRDVKRNLDSDPQGRFKGISLTDVLHWRDREMSDTTQWASSFKKDHVVVPRSELASLYAVVVTPRARRIYLSYPMSYVSRTQMERAAALAEQLREEGYVVFDPGSIDDAQFVGSLGREMEAGEGEGAEYSADELANLAADVGDHTAKMDYVLIKQSHCVVIRYPSVRYRRYMRESGTVVPAMYVPLSAGVVCEMVHGDREGKRVYALWLAKGIEPSPFFRYHCRDIFRTKSELLSHMRKYEPAQG